MLLHFDGFLKNATAQSCHRLSTAFITTTPQKSFAPYCHHINNIRSAWLLSFKNTTMTISFPL
jgi:hypothetical protein